MNSTSSSSIDSQATRLSLLSRVRCDDSLAWSELVELYAPLIAHWCQRWGLDDVASQDCLQEVFMAVLRSLDQYRPQGVQGGFRAWLWTIARHKLIDQHRTRVRGPIAVGGSSAQRRLEQLPELLSSTGQFSECAAGDSNEPTTAAEYRHLLHRGLQQVRAEFEEKTWQAFWRTAIDGLATDVVAQELQLPANAVRQYRSRVLRRLRQQLGDSL